MKKLFFALLLPAISLAILHAQVPDNPQDIAPLLIGETFPDKELTDLDGKPVSILSIAKEKPTVLIFYRGGWCPYCNLHLSEIGKNEEEILKLGFQIIAISPDASKSLQETAGKDEIRYRLLSDASGDLAKATGIAFKAPERYEKRLAENSEGKNPGFLPVPSVFVLNTNGEIVFEHINPDYKKRISGGLLLGVLKALKEEWE